MAYYVIRCSQADDRSLTGRPSAKEAIHVMRLSMEKGWAIEEITRDRRVIDEATLRQDAADEVPFASHFESRTIADTHRTDLYRMVASKKG